MANTYEQALQTAQKELVECDAQAEQLERKRAKLRQTIAVLQSMLGAEVQQDQSVTDAILMITKASNGYVRAAEVMDRMVMMGYQVQTATVATILSRLAKNGQIIHAIGPDGSTGYAWKDSTTPSERLSALSTAMKKVGNRT